MQWNMFYSTSRCAVGQNVNEVQIKMPSLYPITTSYPLVLFAFYHHSNSIVIVTLLASGVASVDDWRGDYSYIVFCIINFFVNLSLLRSEDTRYCKPPNIGPGLI